MAEPFLIEVAYALPAKQVILSVTIAPGTSVLEAVRASNITKHFPELDLEQAKFGIFSQKIDIETYQLQAGDRIEIYRPLIRDPKASRIEKADDSRKHSKKWRAKN